MALETQPVNVTIARGVVAVMRGDDDAAVANLARACLDATYAEHAAALSILKVILGIVDYTFQARMNV